MSWNKTATMYSSLHPYLSNDIILENFLSSAPFRIFSKNRPHFQVVYYPLVHLFSTYLTLLEYRC